jgi:hypothetical protein
MGRQDGAFAVSLAESVANAALLMRATGLPVNGDLGDGCGPKRRRIASPRSRPRLPGDSQGSALRTQPLIQLEEWRSALAYPNMYSR